MVGLESGAVYLPRFRRGGVAVPAPDEDPFTLAATALELLPPEGVRARSVRYVGPPCPTADWGFAALLGHPVDVVAHPPGVEGLLRALSELDPVDPQIIVVADVPGPTANPAGVSREAAGAVALAFGPAGLKVELPRTLPSPRSAIEAARDLLAGLPASARVEATRMAGDAPTPEGPSASWAASSTAVVSEGAYVPRARYLEDLPSRWRLEGRRCSRCSGLTFPSRGRCRTCGAEAGLTPELLPRAGARVVAATTIGRGGQPTEFDAQVEALGAYDVVLAEFAPGVRLTLQVADATAGQLRIGATVGTALRRLYPMEGEWRYGRKAVPLDGASPAG